jgi:hypothetical protein
VGGVELISINAAAERGVTRLRDPGWANPCDHVEIVVLDGRAAPWGKLWAPANWMCSGKDGLPMLLMPGRHHPTCIDPAVPYFVPYAGPHPGSPVYEAECARFKALQDEDTPR